MADGKNFPPVRLPDKPTGALAKIDHLLAAGNVSSPLGPLNVRDVAGLGSALADARAELCAAREWLALCDKASGRNESLEDYKQVAGDRDRAREHYRALTLGFPSRDAMRAVQAVERARDRPGRAHIGVFSGGDIKLDKNGEIAMEPPDADAIIRGVSADVGRVFEGIFGSGPCSVCGQPCRALGPSKTCSLTCYGKLLAKPKPIPEPSDGAPIRKSAHDLSCATRFRGPFPGPCNCSAKETP